MTSRLFSRLTWSEASGALGDLGTFIPLLLGLVRHVGLDLGTTLVVTGIYNVVTGFHFDIPMPVQPMKTIAAVALSDERLTIPELVSAGLTVSAVVLLLGITGGMALFNRLVPFSLVRGIQLGVGLRLAIRGVKMVFYESDSAEWRSYFGPEGLILGLFGSLFILLTTLPVRDNSASGDGGDVSVRQRMLLLTRTWIESSKRSIGDEEKGETERTSGVASTGPSADVQSDSDDRPTRSATCLANTSAIIIGKKIFCNG